MPDVHLQALGTMSGTSLDGVDAAVLTTDGETISSFGPTRFRPYTASERQVLAAALGCWDDDDRIAAARDVIDTAHAEILARFDPPDVIGLHGQTLAHDPHGRGTLQIGSGPLLAEALGVRVVSDFRNADVTLGGEGAPLAPFFHFAALRWAGVGGVVGVLNLGGVGNLSVLDLGKAAPEAPGACLAFDTGPANAPIDDLMAVRTGRACDVDGRIAASGSADAGVVRAVLRHPFFSRMPPKSLDRLDFPDILDRLAGLPLAAAAATLTELVAQAVRAGLVHCDPPPERIFVTGGGRKNLAIMAALRRHLDVSVAPIETIGLDGDMVEAWAFGYLAVRVLRGLPTTAPGTTGVAAPVGGGRVHYPSGQTC